mmetsp:Transcript_451/g.852  ORF Transcript_451/g.852 Transcript_451/m.852 type:complete len:473 (+) Transcript_451:168-1586(+)
MYYNQLLSQLYHVPFYNPAKLGLQNITRLNRKLHDPLRKIPVVHIAGTNGKGSVSVKLAECCRIGGLKTGLFVSPHISTFRERIQIDGSPVSEYDISDGLKEIFKLCQDDNIPATYFEITTALAFLCFKERKCDVVVLEAGLGGKWDSTNIVHPALSVITSVQLDHLNILGNTIEEIAIQKAGIMKPGVDVIVGPDCPTDIMKSEASRIGAIFHQVNCSDAVKSSPAGDLLYDPETVNTAIATAALDTLLRCSREKPDTHAVFGALSTSEAATGLSAALPCRYEFFRCRVSSAIGESIVPVILDLAHNEAGIRTLAWKIKNHYPNFSVRIVVGMSRRPDLRNCIEPLVTILKPQHIYCVEAPHPRAVPENELRDLISELSAQQVESNDTPPGGPTEEERALLSGSFGQEVTARRASSKNNDSVHKGVKEALSACKEGEIVIVCGTAFIMADARYAIGVVEPRDSAVEFCDMM